jgi:putative oxidoreductase
MNNKIRAFLLGGHQQNSISQNTGFFLLRFFVGLALCTVFEKFMPRNGVWGPQEWFIQDTADMGFPFPTFFAWVAVLSEFFGGFLLMLGLFTRPAALLNVFVTFTATFIYHKGDISDSGLLSFFFMLMCLCILLFGPGKFSLDYLVARKLIKSLAKISTVILLLFSFNLTAGQTQSHATPYPKDALTAVSPQVQFYLRNNSLLPKKVVFIIYQPQQEGNNTLVKWFLPFQKKKFYLPAQSRIYIATDSQVDMVMQGRRIDSDKPFIIVDEK